jgi:hypothetical protein
MIDMLIKIDSPVGADIGQAKTETGAMQTGAMQTDAMQTGVVQTIPN